MHTLFVSDLHLSTDQPNIIKLFCEFLKTQAPQADSLYILGDLFEYWIGDDYVEPALEAVLDGLKELTGQGQTVYLMHGNRDFLLGAQFEKLSGCQIIQDPTLIDLYGKPTLIMHGDSLCIDDVDYMKLRMEFRNQETQRFLLSQSIDERLKIARTLRQSSQEATKHKSEQITDVNKSFVIETMKKWQVLQLIHGHTHRPGFHELTIDGQDARRIVLGDWYQQGSVLRCNQQDCTLETIES